MRMITRSMLVVSILTMTVGCGRQGSTGSEDYAPGLGEIMSLQQMRHAKLYFAGQAENWDLAAYELEEIGEGFDDVLKYPPTHKDSPVAPKDAIPRIVNEPIRQVKTA